MTARGRNVSLVAMLLAVALVWLLAVELSDAGAQQAQAAKKCKKKKGKKKCKKAVAPTPAPPATTSPPPPPPADTDGDGAPDSSDNCPLAANPDQGDADADGKGDFCDECPMDSNPGTAACPVSIYDIKDGTVPDGSSVQVSNAIINAITTNDGGSTTVWVAVKETDTDYAGSDYSGLELFVPTGVTLPALAATNRISFDGTVASFFGGIQVTASSVTLTNAGAEAAPAPIAVSSSTFAGPTELDAQLSGVIVTIPSLTLVSQSSGDWTVTDGVVIDNRLMGSLPACAPGTTFTSITGVANYVTGNMVTSDLQLMPRSSADIAGASPAC